MINIYDPDFSILMNVNEIKSQSSSFGVNGILFNGNTMTIIPVEFLFIPILGLPAIYSEYILNSCNHFGTGQWKYVGSS